MNATVHDPRTALRRYTLIIISAAVLLIVGLGGWAATTEFSGAVIAPGQLVVDTNVRKVQHPTGGIVGELRVRDGDHVKGGDILVRLDDTQTRANLAIITKTLDELAAREARFEAERDDRPKVTFPKQLLDRIKEPDIERAINGELQQFESRKSFREGQKAQLQERITQLQQEIQGYEAQIESKKKQVEWITMELGGVKQLWDQKLVAIMRLTALEREKERLNGEIGQLVATIAQSKGKITENELQILQVDHNMRTEVGKELADIRAKQVELIEKRIAAEDQLKRVDIRAPTDGMVHQLTVHTVGGVITAGEPIMLIVPQGDTLFVEAKISPQEIDQLHIGQPAILRFVAFNQRTTPELNGNLSRISADVTEDPKSGQRFYTIRVSVPPEEVKRLGDVRLIPGMPVEALIQTTARTVLSFFVKPFQDNLARAFRER